MEAMRTAAKQMIRRFIRRMEPDVVRISSLNAAGTATLVNKVRSSRGGVNATGLISIVVTALFFVSTVIGAVNLSPADTRRIGKKVWQNECNGTLAGLTS